jgi:hypothetical protein
MTAGTLGAEREFTDGFGILLRDQANETSRGRLPTPPSISTPSHVNEWLEILQFRSIEAPAGP